MRHSLPAAQLITVRVKVLTARVDSFFDVTNIQADSDEEAIGYAIALSTECFGLPLAHIACQVRSRHPVIDC